MSITSPTIWSHFWKRSRDRVEITPHPTPARPPARSRCRRCRPRRGAAAKRTISRQPGAPPASTARPSAVWIATSPIEIGDERRALRPDDRFRQRIAVQKAREREQDNRQPRPAKRAGIRAAPRIITEIATSISLPGSVSCVQHARPPRSPSSATKPTDERRAAPAAATRDSRPRRRPPDDRAR